MTILIIRFSSLGDIVLTTSVVEALSRSHPDAEIHFLTKEQYAPLFQADKRIARVITLGRKETVAGLRRRLDAYSYDVILDLHSSIRSRLIATKLKAFQKLCIKKNAIQRRLMVLSRGRYRVNLDVLGNMLDTVRPFGVEERVYPRLLPNTTEIEKLKAQLPDEGEALVGIAPGARHAMKRWYAESYARLADELHVSGRIPVFIGDKNDSAFIDEIRGNMKADSLSFAGALDLASTVSLISLMAAVVTNDSGPMHIAGALNVPFAAVFGPTHPDLGFAPGYPGSIVLHANIPCSPCSIHGEKPCRMKTRLCMDGINWRNVYDTIIRLTSTDMTSK